MGALKHCVSSLLLLLVVHGVLPRAESKTFWGDVQVLKQFKNGVELNSVSPGSCLSSWDFSVDPCDSLFSERFTCGFRCDVTVSGLSRVTEVSLDSAGYAGSLSSTSWNLPYLQTLELSNNFFSGWIPGSLSNLTRLTRLGLSRNAFSGEIPASIGSLSSLEELYLDNNNLQGTIPTSFNGLVSLKRLEIQSNNISGEFPELGSLKNLYFLDASDNAISRYLPTTLSPCLVQISMRNNMIEGTIPQSLKNLSFLQVLDLRRNKFVGSVPYFLFNHPSLQQLSLAFNSFDSLQSPSNLGTQSRLIAVDLSNNELQGWLPPFLPLMPKLSALSLENNKLSGMIPAQYALRAVLPVSGIAPFARLLLGGNYLFGPIPGPLLVLKPDTANVSLADNCLIRCPLRFFFCQGADQKSLTECNSFGSKHSPSRKQPQQSKAKPGGNQRKEKLIGEKRCCGFDASRPDLLKLFDFCHPYWANAILSTVFCGEINDPMARSKSSRESQSRQVSAIPIAGKPKEIFDNLRIERSKWTVSNRRWRTQKTQLIKCAMGASNGDMAGESGSSIFPRINVSNPYKRLGISKEASEDEIQAARNFLISRYGGHKPSVDAIEAAHDKIIMQKFYERRNPKIDIKKKVREVKQSRVVQAVTSRFQTPASKFIVKTSLAFLVLGVLTVLFPTEEGPTLQVALSLIATFYFIHDRLKSKIRALLYGAGAFIFSWLVGTFLMVSVIPPISILKGLRSFEVLTSLITYVLLWVSSTYLK
ncbi:hypothetical protein V6N13_052499 [Hibiscus sabdariffa]